jgi:hypothetical protein
MAHFLKTHYQRAHPLSLFQQTALTPNQQQQAEKNTLPSKQLNHEKKLKELKRKNVPKIAPQSFKSLDVDVKKQL